MEFLRSFLRRHFAGKLTSGGFAKCRLFSFKLAPGVQVSVRLEQAQLQVGAVKYFISFDSVMPLSQRFSLCSRRWPRLEIWPACCLTFELNIRICTREKPKTIVSKACECERIQVKMGQKSLTLCVSSFRCWSGRADLWSFNGFYVLSIILIKNKPIPIKPIKCKWP